MAMHARRARPETLYGCGKAYARMARSLVAEVAPWVTGWEGAGVGGLGSRLPRDGLQNPLMTAGPSGREPYHPSVRLRELTRERLVRRPGCRAARLTRLRVPRCRGLPRLSELPEHPLKGRVAPQRREQRVRAKPRIARESRVDCAAEPRPCLARLPRLRVRHPDAIGDVVLHG